MYLLGFENANFQRVSIFKVVLALLRMVSGVLK